MKNDFLYNLLNKWIKSISFEVGAHDAGMFCIDKKTDRRLVHREFSYSYDKTIKFTSEDIILDVGSGAIPIYGNLFDGNKGNYIPVDSLVYEYEKLYRKYNIELPVKPRFGIMEVLSLFFHRNSADYIICNNALDHSIDIMQSLLELISVVKIGGSVLLAHHNHEAENNNYDGFHQWNVSSENEHLIFYNKKWRYDVSEIISKFCDTTISLNDDPGRDGALIVSKIIKRGEIPTSIYQKYSNHDFLGNLLQCLFNEMALSSSGYMPSGEAFLDDSASYVVWGIGNVGRECLSWFGNKRSLIKFYIDKDIPLSGEWRGYCVKHLSEYRRSDGFLIIASTRYESEIVSELLLSGYEKGKDFLPYNEFKSLICSTGKII